MSSNIILPNEAVPYILMQRTAYLRFPRSALYRLAKPVLPGWTFRALVQAEGRLSSSRVKSAYSEDLQSEYETIRPHLPSPCERVLDIGCGVAGLDVLLALHYGAPGPEFVLLDKSHVEGSVFYGYEQRGAFYNSLEVARVVLTGSGIDPARISLLEATDANDIELPNESVDLVVSLISWGFHYPVETYLGRVHEVLRPGGTLILDVRTDTEGLRLIERAFRNTEVVVDERKYKRIRAIK